MQYTNIYTRLNENRGNNPEVVGGIPQTRRTRPHGRDLCVWAVEGGGDPADTKNTTVGSRSQVWGVSNIPDIPDTKNATMWSHPSCLGGGRKGREGAGTPQTRRTRPCGRVLRVWVVEGGCSCRVGGGLVAEENQGHQKHVP